MPRDQAGVEQSELPKIDEEFEAITEGEELRFAGATWRFLATADDQSAGDGSSLALVFRSRASMRPKTNE